MDKENREEKKPEAKEGAKWDGSVRIQKSRVNKDNSENQNQQTNNDIYDATLQQARWYRFLRSPDKVAIVLITLTYTVFAGLQWCSIKESNRINQEALFSVQRAHVNIKNIKSIGIRDAQSRITAWHFFPQWENSGATPTKIMCQRSSAKWLKETLPHNFDFPDAGPNNNIKTLLSPKAIVSTGPLIIHPDVIAGVKEGRLHLFFWGWAAYRDIFQNSKAHLTEFCYELTVSRGDVTTGERIKFLFTLYPSHNCADEDCKDYAETEKRLKER